MHFETPHNEIECILSIKDSNFNLIEEMLLYLKTYSLNFGKIFNLNISLKVDLHTSPNYNSLKSSLCRAQYLKLPSMTVALNIFFFLWSAFSFAFIGCRNVYCNPSFITVWLLHFRFKIQRSCRCCGEVGAMEVRFSKWFHSSYVKNAKRLGLKTFYSRVD